MHFQDARAGKAAHQRLAHAGGVRAGLGGQHQGFAHGFDGERHDDLVGHLGDLAVAHAAHQRDVLAHELEQRQHAVEHVLLAAGHDR